MSEGSPTTITSCDANEKFGGPGLMVLLAFFFFPGPGAAVAEDLRLRRLLAGL